MRKKPNDEAILSVAYQRGIVILVTILILGVLSSNILSFKNSERLSSIMSIAESNSTRIDTIKVLIGSVMIRSDIEPTTTDYRRMMVYKTEPTSINSIDSVLIQLYNGIDPLDIDEVYALTWENLINDNYDPYSPIIIVLNDEYPQ